MQNISTYGKLAMKFVKGVCGLVKKEYDLQFVFVPEDNLWYIDMPWPGDRYNLAMVAGSDKMLHHLAGMRMEQMKRQGIGVEERCKDLNRVRALVRPSKEPNAELIAQGYCECERSFPSLDASWGERVSRCTSGATYKVHFLEGFNREIWICPVTLTVLGHYPKYIYIKQIPL